MTMDSWGALARVLIYDHDYTFAAIFFISYTFIAGNEQKTKLYILHQLLKRWHLGMRFWHVFVAFAFYKNVAIVG